VPGMVGSGSHPSTPPRPHTRVRAPAKLSPRFAAIVVLTTSRGWPSVVTLGVLRSAGIQCYRIGN